MRGKLSKKELKDALQIYAQGSGVSHLPKSDEDDDALHVFAKAFEDDPMFVWVAGLQEDDPEKEAKMHRLNKNLFVYHSHRSLTGKRGVALGVRSDNDVLVGCMTLTPSAYVKERWIDNLRSFMKAGSPPIYKSKEKGRYGPNACKRLEMLSMLPKRRTKHMKDMKKWIYLQSIGVLPEYQHGKGFGKRMLQVLLKTADSLKVPIYLETESEHNESLYKHFGFGTVEVLDICVKGDTSPDANMKFWLMRRNPRGLGDKGTWCMSEH